MQQRRAFQFNFLFFHVFYKLNKYKHSSKGTSNNEKKKGTLNKSDEIITKTRKKKLVFYFPQIVL